MEKVKLKGYPSNDISIAPTVFHSSFEVDPKFPPKDMNNMVNTWINIEDDREIVDSIVDSIVDEELENFDDFSAINSDVYDDDCEEEGISIKDQMYKHIEALEEMDVIISYMPVNAFPIKSFNILDRLHLTAHQQRFKGNTKEPSIFSFFQQKKTGSSIQV